ncbi:MAG: PaaI family thioesterase [Myxococcota bacterium]
MSDEKVDREQLQAFLQHAPFHQFLRMEIDEVDADAQRLVLRLPFRREYQRMQEVPQIHGGPIAALIDIAGTYVIWAVLGQGVPTINLRIDYLRPAVDTGLRATATVRRAGRTVALVDIDVHDDRGRLVAVGRGSYGTQSTQGASR